MNTELFKIVKIKKKKQHKKLRKHIESRYNHAAQSAGENGKHVTQCIWEISHIPHAPFSTFTIYSNHVELVGVCFRLKAQYFHK